MKRSSTMFRGSSRERRQRDLDGDVADSLVQLLQVSRWQAAEKPTDQMQRYDTEKRP
jgi:hypothetical protein